MENMQNVTAALNALGVKTCLACGKAGAKSLCMGCRSVSFCGKACQKVAWPGHREECRRIVREKDVAARVAAAKMARLLDPIAAAFAADGAMAAEERRAASKEDRSAAMLPRRATKEDERAGVVT